MEQLLFCEIPPETKLRRLATLALFQRQLRCVCATGLILALADPLRSDWPSYCSRTAPQHVNSATVPVPIVLGALHCTLYRTQWFAESCLPVLGWTKSLQAWLLPEWPRSSREQTAVSSRQDSCKAPAGTLADIALAGDWKCNTVREESRVGE